MKVTDIVTRNVVSVAPDATIGDAVALMLKRRISGLPVIDFHRKLVGIVSRANLLRALATVHREVGAGRATDAEIRDQILAQVGRQSWTAGADVRRDRA